jgi:alanine racemase
LSDDVINVGRIVMPLIMIELTDVEMFKGLTEVEIENSFFDLHNDFNCSNFSFDASKREIIISFLSIDKNENFIYVLKDASIEKMCLNRIR